MGDKYVNGNPIRQDFLETVLGWFVGKDDKLICTYMGKHQNDSNANELWVYFQFVIAWVKALFPNYRKDMKNRRVYVRYVASILILLKWKETILFHGAVAVKPFMKTYRCCAESVIIQKVINKPYQTTPLDTTLIHGYNTIGETKNERSMQYYNHPRREKDSCNN